MSTYFLTRGAANGATKINGIDTVAVWAGSTDDAIAMVQNLIPGDSDSVWAAVTPVHSVAGVDMEDWTLHVIVSKANGTVEHDVSVVGEAGHLMTDLADLMVTALIADGLTNADWTSPTLTVDDGGLLIGDRHLEVYAYPPTSTEVPVVGLVGVITELGAAGAALDVDLTAVAIPIILGQFKSC